MHLHFGSYHTELCISPVSFASTQHLLISDMYAIHYWSVFHS